jgi:phosphoadenosine phosphosulfate reductase
MNKAFVREVDPPDPSCPEPRGCGATGSNVPLSALRAQLSTEDAARFPQGAYYCATPTCPVAFFDRSFEFPETRSFIHRLAEQWSLNLDIIPTRYTTLQLMRACGNWDHNATEHNVPNLRRTLITEPATIAHDHHGPGELWGVRAKESRGRRILYANDLRDEVTRSCHGCCPTPAQQRETHGGITRRKNLTISYGPVWNWTTDDIWGYHARHQLPINPVYQKLRSLGAPEHMLRVGQVLNGDIVATSQVTWLKRGWPSLFEELAAALPRVRELA